MSSWRSEYGRMLASGPHSLTAFVVFCGLWPLSIIYGLAMTLRRALYRFGLKNSYRAAVPVVCVGNLTTGGTGKTPMVDFLAKRLGGRGIKCAIVSRGYAGRYRQKVGRVLDASGNRLMTPEECGDEPYLLAIRNPGVPVYVARNRKLGVQAAEQDGARLLLLDDGFQHLALQRDANIVLLDAKHPIGNGHLLPAGMLREPLSALQRADLLVLTRHDQHSKLPLKADVPVMRSRHVLDGTLKSLAGEVVSAKICVGKSCLAFAGIAKPEAFFAALREFGFRHIDEMPLSDHQAYNQEILNRLLRSCHNYDMLVTTEKDAVKLSSAKFPVPCYQVGVNLVFDDMSPLDNLFDQILESGT
ncbi:MAG: tetraacyldisaccharide 4'-kinase [Desulfuromonadales bacterium]